jgi:hypothetical protein
MGLQTGWTRLICKQSHPEFWDRTAIQSGLHILDWTVWWSPKKLRSDCVAVQSQFKKLNGPSVRGFRPFYQKRLGRYLRQPLGIKSYAAHS